MTEHDAHRRSQAFDDLDDSASGRPGTAGPAGRMQIARILDDARTRAQMTQVDVAKAAGVSPGTVNRYLSWQDRSKLKASTVRAIADACGAPHAVREALVRLVQAQDSGWWMDDPGIPEIVAPLVSFEDYARYEHAYANALIPALLQTRAYAEALHRTPDVRLDTEAVEARVEARMRRQEIFDRADPLDYWAILDEAVLRRPVGTPEVMSQQIAHIQEMSERPNVGVQILPFSRGAHAAGSGGHFVLLGRDDEGTPLDSLHVVYLELPRKGVYLDTPSDIHAYRVMYDYLRSTAADPASSSSLLEAARQEYSA